VRFFNYYKLKYKIILFFIIFLAFHVNEAFSELEIDTYNQVYTTGQPLLVYGKGLPDETLIIRVSTPDDTIAKFDQITASSEGAFSHVLLTWPESSPNFPYGTYTIEVISTQQDGISKKIDVKFLATAEIQKIPVERHISTLVFAPETAAVNVPFRVFVQTTSDGLLIGDDPKALLSTTHVHLPSGQVDTLSDSLSVLHKGLFFLDYTPNSEGTYVFHVVAFNQGTESHGSFATTVLSQDLGGISDQLIKLNSVLNETSDKLTTVKSEIEGFGSTLDTASTNIDSSVASISDSVNTMKEASSQLNSLLFPIVGSIGIIVALQIAILARRR
jgi:hypothetical protein